MKIFMQVVAGGLSLGLLKEFSDRYFLFYLLKKMEGKISPQSILITNRNFVHQIKICIMMLKHKSTLDMI
jgi:hypothetical protein